MEGRTVFVVDDDQLSIFITESIISMECPGTAIKGFLSAEEALQALRAGVQLPDVMLLDLNMPGMDGWEFLDEIAALMLPDALCSLYILTSSLDISDTARAREYSFVTGLLHKPITAADIPIIFDHQNNLLGQQFTS